MANYKRQNLSDANAATLESFFSSLNCPLISTEISGGIFKITVDEIVVINMTLLNSAWLNPITITYNGSTTAEIGRSWFQNGCQFTCICSDTLFYLQLRDSSGRRFGFIYEKIGTESYFGYKGSGNSQSIAFYNLSDFDLIKVGESNANYKHSTILNYSVNLGSIDMLNNDILLLSGVRAAEDPNFKTTTSLTSDSMITINGLNYYVISSHTIINVVII